MFFKLHVADDIRTQRPSVVRQDGAAKSGMKFLGDGCATNLRSTFEYQGFKARLREVKAVTSPLCPPPMMTTSRVSGMS
jgi:hypothetical protein